MGNACIGFFNHKFFVLYLAYMIIGLVSVSIFFTDYALTAKYGFLDLMANSINGTVIWLLSSILSIGLGILLAI